MTEDSKPTLHAGIVIMESTGKEIADPAVDYWMNDSDPPDIPIDSLLRMPAAPEWLLLKMDDGRFQKFQVQKSGSAPTIHYEGPPWRPGESQFNYRR
jgi:hypothetical protein